MIASLPIEATRARFQTRPSNWLLQFSAALAGSCQSIYEPAVCRSRTPVASYQARSAACGLSSAILSQKAAMSCLWMPTWGVACHRQPHEATSVLFLRSVAQMQSVTAPARVIPTRIEAGLIDFGVEKHHSMARKLCNEFGTTITK
jgi:hypothetical protein